MPTYTYDEVLKSDVKREYILKPFLPKGGNPADCCARKIHEDIPRIAISPGYCGW